MVGKRKAGTMEGKGREVRGALVGGGRDHSMPPQADELGSNKNQKNNNKKYQNGSGQHTLGGPKCPPSLPVEVTSVCFEAPCSPFGNDQCASRP